MAFESSYLELFRSGELTRRRETLRKKLESCDLCPHCCGANRAAGNTGYCRTGTEPGLASAAPHFGEEPPLVGTGGSGAIFFTNCNMACVFCQNHDISQPAGTRGESVESAGSGGRRITTDQLAQVMLVLQAKGCHNINFVTPTHIVPAIVEALLIAIPRGFRLPLVYNSGGYDSVETIQLLDGVFDIYMPDFKYGDDETGFRLSGVKKYAEHARRAVREMHGQVGDLRSDSRGIAQQGVIVRHLVLPNGLAGSEKVIDFIAGLSKDTYLNIMDQYRPCFRASEHPGLRRRPTLQEVDEVLSYAERAGLRNFL